MTDTPAAHAASSTPVVTQVAAGNGGFYGNEKKQKKVRISGAGYASSGSRIQGLR